MAKELLLLIGLVFLIFFAFLEINSGRLTKVIWGIYWLIVAACLGLFSIYDSFNGLIMKVIVSAIYVLAIVSLVVWLIRANSARSKLSEHKDSSVKYH